MEDSLEYWISHLEMEEYGVLNESDNGLADEEEFLREILEQPEDKREEHNPFTTIQGNNTVSFDEAETLHKSNSSNSIKSLKISSPSPSFPAVTTTTTTPYHLSFDTSNETQSVKVKDGCENEALIPQFQPRKRVRVSSEMQNHIIAERKRRQKLTGSFIALSAIIPGLKKVDKVYVLGEAIIYIKQLQDRIKELENQNKVDSATFIRKPQASSSYKSTNNCATNKESLFEVEARILDDEVLVGIHCKKQKDIVFKIYAILEKLHLSTKSSTVLPFGTSTLIVNIVAQMNDEYSMTKDDLVKKLREYMLKVHATVTN